MIGSRWNDNNTDVVADCWDDCIIVDDDSGSAICIDGVDNKSHNNSKARCKKDQNFALFAGPSSVPFVVAPASAKVVSISSLE